jgi:hypothetical protein
LVRPLSHLQFPKSARVNYYPRWYLLPFGVRPIKWPYIKSKKMLDFNLETLVKPNHGIFVIF